MLRAGRMQKGIRGSLLASLAALVIAGLATSVQAANFIQFNPTGGGIGGTTNVGNLTNISSIDESPGNAIAVGFFPSNGLGGFTLPTVGQTFTLDYQANIQSLTGATPAFSYGGASTGQLTAVASFQEIITGFANLGAGGTVATFATTGVGTFSIYFNPNLTSATNPANTSGLNFAPGNTSNTVADSTFTLVYQGTIQSLAANSNNTGVFNVTSPAGMNGGPLDTAPGGNLFPAISSVNGKGSSESDATTTFANPLFFTGGAPSSIAVSFTNSSNNLPFTTVQPNLVIYNGTSTGQAGATVASVGTVNGGINSSGTLASGPNVLFQADANTSFGPLAVTTPEPGTISAALTGVGFAFLTGVRAKRRRNKTTTV